MSFYSGGIIPLYLSNARLLASKTSAGAASPNISFQGDLDTGIYSPGDNLLAISTGGVTSSLFTSAGIKLPDGSSATPSISFLSDTDTGLFRTTTNELAITAGGVRKAVFTSTAIYLEDETYYPDGSVSVPSISFNSDTDTGLFRTTTNQIGISTGGATAASFDASVTAGQTRFLIYDVDNATLERVTVGAADSGGSGFKVLRIPN
jgi:hypothetical protein